jgi:tetratricopeptide (TPR) repeat protein
MTIDAIARAESLRLAGRWEEALAALDGIDTAEASLERVQVLSDEHLFARDRGAEIQQGLDRVAEFATADGDPALEAFVLSRRGLALHVQFLANPDAGEPPEVMSLFERALEIRESLDDRRGAAESFFQIGLVHQIARQDEEAARSCFQRAYELADEVGDGVLMSYAIRHIGYLEQLAGNLDGAEAAFQESLQLREAAGWEPGVAAAQLALAGALAAKNRAADARALATSADRLLTDLHCDRLRSLVADELKTLGAAT